MPGRGAMHGGFRRGRRGRRWMDAQGTLLALRPGEDGVVGHIADDSARAQAVRFGIGDGALITCITTLPGGPVVLRAGRQEIAVGRGLAARIEVRPVMAPGAVSA
ncbi:MAG: FeoA family protein [Coriobacteriia bacterium]